MYGQLYHRTISRELPEPQRNPRGRVRRGGWRGADGRRRLHVWAGLGWRGAEVRLARGWGSVGAGRGPGGAGERASVGAMRRRGQHEDGRKSPIDSSSRPQWAARRMAACVGAMRAAKRDACKTAAMNAGGGHKRDGRGRACGKQARPAMAGGACGKQARPAPQGAKPVRSCRVSHTAAAWRKAHSAGPQAAAAERPRGAGNIFAPCVISGSPTRKRALGGKIRAPCIPNRPIAPGNGCMGRGCCHLDLEKHAFRADVARKGAFFAHSAKKGCMRCDSCQPGPWGRRNARGGRGRRRAAGAMGGAMRAGLPDGNDLDDDSGSARWRHRGTRAAGSSA